MGGCTTDVYGLEGSGKGRVLTWTSRSVPASGVNHRGNKGVARILYPDHDFHDIPRAHWLWLKNMAFFR
jgi:hypothetical protein